MEELKEIFVTLAIGLTVIALVILVSYLLKIRFDLILIFIAFWMALRVSVKFENRNRP